MADPKSLEADAVNFASRAVNCDKEGLVDTAVFYYRVCTFICSLYTIYSLAIVHL